LTQTPTATQRNQASLIARHTSLSAFLRCCLQDQQRLQELGLDAETQRNAAGNSYSMMRARIQQLPAPTFTEEVGAAHGCS
jgi:hypothetical protein